MTQPEHKHSREMSIKNGTAPFQTAMPPEAYKAIYNKYRDSLKQQNNAQIGWSDMFAHLNADEVRALFTKASRRGITKKLSAHNVFNKSMPKPDLPPVFPNRPLKLNEDGTTINYRKSHAGPHAEY